LLDELESWSEEEDEEDDVELVLSEEIEK